MFYIIVSVCRLTIGYILDAVFCDWYIRPLVALFCCRHWLYGTIKDDVPQTDSMYDYYVCLFQSEAIIRDGMSNMYLYLKCSDTLICI